MGILRLIMFFCFLIQFIAAEGQDLIPKMKMSPSDIPALKSDTSALYRMSVRALNLLSQPSAIHQAGATIDSATYFAKHNGLKLPSITMLALAEYYLVMGDLVRAQQMGMKALGQAKGFDEPYIVVRSYNFMGRYYEKTADFNQSLKSFNSSIREAEERGIKGIIPSSYEGLANYCLAVGDERMYKKNYQEMINSAMAEKDSVLAAKGYLTLGSFIVDKKDDFKGADSLLRKCLKISKILKDTANIVWSLSDIGRNFYQEGINDSAMKYYQNSIKLSTSKNLFSASAYTFGYIAKLLRDEKKTKDSFKIYMDAIRYARQGKDLEILAWLYRDISDLHLKNKNISEAYVNFVLYKQVSDSIVSTQNAEAMAIARARYEVDTNNREMQVLSLRYKNQKLLFFGVSGLLLLAIIIGLLIYNRSKINTQRRISEMNRKISEITQANLRQQMNPHFIFNTLNSIQYYMYQHDKLATNIYLTKFSSLMRKILENSQNTSVTLQDELDALTLYLDLESIRFKDKFEFKIIVDEEIDTLLYKIPTMLIQPYVENSICHGVMPGETKGFISIDLKLESDYISCKIEDNGIGREAAQENKKKRGHNHNSLGTRIASSRLDLVNALYGTSLKTIYTDLKDGNGEPKGTRVEIHIPIIP